MRVIAARDAVARSQARAELLLELADEEHESAWEAAIEYRWRVDLGAPDAAIREVARQYHECRNRESDYRQRAAKESK